MGNFFKGLRKGFFRTMGRIGSGLATAGKFLWRHKFMVLFLSIFGTAALVTLGNIIAGTFVAGIIVEALAIGLVVGAVEMLAYGGIVSIENHRKKKEIKLAKQIEQLNAQEELGKTKSQNQRYKILKKLAKVRYKLAKSSYYRTGKTMSLFQGKRFYTSKREKRLGDKLAFINAKAHKLQVEGLESEYKQHKYEKLRDRKLKRVENAYRNITGNQPQTPYQWKKNIKSPVDGIDEMQIEKTQINCHLESTFTEFKSYAKNDKLTQGRERIIEVAYSPESKIISSSARFVNKAYRNQTSILLLNEALELANEKGDIVFPIKYTFIDANNRGKNIKISNKDELERFIKSFSVSHEKPENKPPQEL